MNLGSMEEWKYGHSSWHLLSHVDWPVTCLDQKKVHVSSKLSLERLVSRPSPAPGIPGLLHKGACVSCLEQRDLGITGIVSETPINFSSQMQMLEGAPVKTSQAFPAHHNPSTDPQIYEPNKWQLLWVTKNDFRQSKTQYIPIMVKGVY